MRQKLLQLYTLIGEEGSYSDQNKNFLLKCSSIADIFQALWQFFEERGEAKNEKIRYGGPRQIRTAVRAMRMRCFTIKL